MAPSRNSFNASKDYRKVVWNAQNAVLDFDLNEAQDIIGDRIDRLAATLFDGVSLVGNAGRVTGSASARAVDISGGLAVSAGQTVRIPAVAALAAFSGAATGVQVATIYVDWNDSDVAGSADTDILDPAYGADNTHRTKRNVQVLAVSGAALPAPSGGHTLFKLATVTHDFGVGNLILNADIALEPYGPSLGELGGSGAGRGLRLTSNTQTTTDDAFVLDTRRSLGAAEVLFRLRNLGVNRISVTGDGRVGFGGAPPTGYALNIPAAVGKASIGAVLEMGDNITMASGKLVDTIDIDAHDHSGAAGHGVQIDHGNLVGLAADNHTQYVHNTIARTVTAKHTFNPTTAGNAPFILGANAQGAKVLGLHADLLDGYEAADLLNLVNATGTLPDARLAANVARIDASKIWSQLQAYAVSGIALEVGGVAAPGNFYSWTLDNQGTMCWGSGAAVTDTRFYRSVAGKMRLESVLDVVSAIQLNGLDVIDASRTLVNMTLGASIMADLNSRYVRKNIGGDTSDTLSLTGQLILSPGAPLRSDGVIAILTTTGGSAQGINIGQLLVSDSYVDVSGVPANGIYVKGNSYLKGRTTLNGNLFDNVSGGISQAVTSQTDIQITGCIVVRGLVSYLKVNPGTYSGLYDVAAYAVSGDGGSEVLAQWTNQSGIMEDKAPWYVKNATNGGLFYIRITKQTTGTAHTFTIGVRMELFA